METKGWNLPRGITKEDIKAREKVIKDFYAHWISGNPEKKVWNDNLQDYILSANHLCAEYAFPAYVSRGSRLFTDNIQK